MPSRKLALPASATARRRSRWTSFEGHPATKGHRPVARSSSPSPPPLKSPSTTTDQQSAVPHRAAPSAIVSSRRSLTGRLRRRLACARRTATAEEARSVAFLIFNRTSTSSVRAAGGLRWSSANRPSDPNAAFALVKRYGVAANGKVAPSTIVRMRAAASRCRVTPAWRNASTVASSVGGIVASSRSVAAPSGP
jgi:hypothetical protein